VSDGQGGLPDGRYDAFVIDASQLAEGRMHLELTVLAGDHKGEVVEVAAQGLRGDEIELLGMPATITVTDGVPHVRIDA
jgi:hypothetical protein